MYCNNCGKKVISGEYCPYCGSTIKSNDVPIENKVWGIFARIGWGLGLGGLIGCLFFGMGGIFGIPGIVFSALGKRSNYYSHKAKSGLTMSIIATTIFCLVYFGIIILAASTGNWDTVDFESIFFKL